MKKILSLSVVLSSVLFGAGYQIPNSSINSSALATANVANAHGADAAYYNPANMSFFDYDGSEVEQSLTYVSLSSINYDPSNGDPDIKSVHHDAFIPSLHFVSKKLTDSGIRMGISMVSPAGLSREWVDSPAVLTAEKFALKTIELNPSISIPINDKLSVGLGLRYLYSSGEVQFYGSDIEGDDYAAFGYNLAVSYNATKQLNISMTYRNKVTLNLSGYDKKRSDDVSTKVLVPANFILATAYRLQPTTTLEITYDRTMWSALKESRFDFATTSDVVSVKNWHDTEAYRIGLTKNLNDLTLMGGFAYSTNATSDKYISYSSPESDSFTYSMGARYKVNDKMNVGFALLYAYYQSRTLEQGTATGVNGTLSGKTATTLTLGLNYRF